MIKSLNGNQNMLLQQYKTETNLSTIAIKSYNEQSGARLQKAQPSHYEKVFTCHQRTPASIWKVYESLDKHRDEENKSNSSTKGASCPILHLWVIYFAVSSLHKLTTKSMMKPTRVYRMFLTWNIFRRNFHYTSD